MWLVGLGLYFIAVRPPLLPEDARFMEATATQIQVAVPGLEAWLKQVFTVMGGFMAGTGVLTVFVAIVAMPCRLKGTSWAIALAGALTVALSSKCGFATFLDPRGGRPASAGLGALMSATNFALHSDFRWLLLVPALVWLAGLVLHVISGRNTRPVSGATRA